MTSVATATLPVHLSVVILNADNPAVAAETRDCHRMHARVAGLFDGLPGFDGARVLWSLPRPDVLLLQGAAPIATTHLPDGYAASATTRQVAAPAAGSRVAVSLVGNPTHRPRTPEQAVARQRGARTQVPPPQAVAWFVRKLEHALDLDPAKTGSQVLPAARGRRDGAQQVVLARRCFHAEGSVIDQVEFARILLAGVGAGKGYGCGLLIAQERPS